MSERIALARRCAIIRGNNMAKNGLLIALMAVLIVAAGCEKWSDEYLKTSKYRFLSPEKVIERPEDAQVNLIINSLGDVDKEDQLFPNARRPREEDWVYEDTDYVLTAGDVVDINIMDLYAEGVQTALRKEISQSGYIDLPLIPERIRAEGLTQVQLVDEIKEAYRKTVLKDPQIAVVILSRRQQTFSISGAVGQPGTYQITKKDMRMLDVLALCGGVYQPDIEYIYIIRQAKAIRKSESGIPKPAATKPASTKPAPVKGNQIKELDELMNGKINDAQADLAEASLAGVEGAAPATTASEPEKKEAPAEAASTPAKTKEYRWQFVNNRWVKVPVGETVEQVKAEMDKQEAAREPVVRIQKNEPNKDPFDWANLEKTELVEVIAINRRKLEQGDFRQNIVIHDNDYIRVPPIILGTFYLMGEVARPGAYTLTSKGLTVKMAVAAAGNLGPMAWPENSMIIRRVGKNQEQMIPVNVEKIFKGEDPDVYLKDNDVLAVGTHWSSVFLAVIRNAFRMSYGFGFVYDRNFADPYSPSLNSQRFSRW